MKKTCVAILAFFLCLPLFLHSRLVTRDEAQTVSARLIDLERTMSRLRTTQCDFLFRSVEPLILQEELVGYLVRLAPQGFIIMPGWTEESPAKFICFSGDFEEIRDHPFIRQLLDRLLYVKVRLNYSLNPALVAVFSSVPDSLNSDLVVRNETSWDRFLSSSTAVSSVLSEEEPPVGDVPPLTVSTWNQGSPYNNYTPRVGTTPTYTGCSATAQAQVMYFWKYPAVGQGSHSYLWSGQTLSADFNHEYYWSRMTNSYSSSSSAEAKDAVARLMSDVGISINMNYGTSGSGAVPNANNSLYTFFKYSYELNYEYRYHYATWTDWFNMFKGQADKHWPAILATFQTSAGHAVVIDGYRTTPSNQVHVNMGWGGSADAYYDMNNILGYGNASIDYAVVDIHPPDLPPSITVATPNGGENWALASSHSIQWNTYGITGNVKIGLFKGGTHLGNIAAGVPASQGSYSWPVGLPLLNGATYGIGSDYRIQVQSEADWTKKDQSDNNFTISGTSSVQVISPNGGENWALASTQSIRWNGYGLTGNVKLGLFKGGVHQGNIAVGVAAGQGSYSWQVGLPLLNGASYTVGSDYKIQVQSEADWTKKDQSDGNFTISGSPAVTVIAPNGGESWAMASTQAITWSAVGLTGNVKIGLFKGGVHLGNIADDVPAGLGSYNWHVGDTLLNGVTYAAGSDYRIQVQSKVDWTKKDQSDGMFIIN